MRQALGQHFLINKTAIEKIVAVLDLQPNDVVIEIGPGQGELTLPIAKKCQEIGCKIIAIEKDPALVSKLISLKVDKLQILKGDILKILPQINKTPELKNLQTYKLVGNIPFYITGKLLRTLSELKSKPTLTVLMIQKEVAERICAKPLRRRQGSGGQAKMNLLAAAVQFWAEPKIVFTLKPRDFKPPPKVESAVIQLTLRPMTNDLQPTDYYKFIRIIFKQPRKTLLNNLQQGLEMPKNAIENTLKTLQIDPQCRPQDLSVENLKKLSVKLS